VFSAIKIPSAVLLLYVLGKNLSPQQYGVYSLINSTVIVGMYVLGLDLYAYTMRWVPGCSVRERGMIFKTLVVFELLVAGSIGVIVVSAGLDRTLASLLNIEGSWQLFRAGLLILMLNLVMREIIRYLFALKRIEAANKVELIGLSSFIYILALLWLVGKGVGLPVVLWLWGVALMIAVWYGLAKIEVRQVAASPMDGNILRAAFLFSGPLYLATLGTQITGYADRFLLSSFLSASDAGLYSLVYNLVATGIFFWGSLFSEVLMPYVTEYHNREMLPQRDTMINLMLKYSYLATIPAAVLTFGLRSEILQIMARSDFASAEAIVPILLVVPMAMVMVIPANTILLLQERTGLSAAVRFGGAVLNILLNIALIPRYGMLGAAWASVVGFGVVLILGYLSVYRSGIISWESSKARELLVANIVLLAFVHYARLGVSAWLGHLELGAVAMLLLLGALAVLVYAVLVWMLRIMGSEEIQQLRGLFAGRFS
jgi:O-antigen/teichoic acid export membrane protein